MVTTDRIAGLTTGVAIKAPVDAATTANITLSGEQTIDGVSVTAGDRVLVKDQTNAAENGIYAVSATSWARSKDFDGPRDVRTGTMVLCTAGTENANTFWRVTTANDITIGTSSVAFARSANQLAGVTTFVETLLDDASATEFLTTLGVSAFIQTLIDDANAGAARTTMGLGDAAVEDVAAGGSGDLLRADGDGSSLTGVSASDQTARDNTILNAMDILELQGGAVKALKNMVVDAFEDETGIDTGSSSNEQYDASGDFYTNFAQSKISAGTGAVIGDMTNGGGNSAAFDGNANQGSAAGAAKNTSTVAYIGKDWGASNDKTLTGFGAWGSNNLGFKSGTGSVTITLIGHTSNDPGAATDLGSLTFTDTDTAVERTKLSGVSSGTAFRYHWLKIEVANAGLDINCAEADFYETPVVDMVLLTNAITAASAPAEIRVVVDHEAVDSVTVNTDLVAAVSRDGGTTWTNATLAEIRDAGSGRVVFAADIDVSGQPSGTSVKARITTANSKAQRVHKLAIQADVALTV